MVGAKGRARAEIGVIRGGVTRPILLTSPVQDKLGAFAAENRSLFDRPVMAEEGTFAGQVLALCGAGPSLADADLSAYDHVWACNSALPYLWERGDDPTAGVCIDQTPTTILEWADPPPVPYYLATTVDPDLTRHLLAHDRDLHWFHSLVGFDGEIPTYKTWPKGYLVFQGHNVVGRAIHLALWMGFERVDVFGADSAFGPNDVTHANGTTAEDAYGGRVDVFQADIDGRIWRTRADMLIAAVDLARVALASNGKVRLIGDTLPNAIMDKGEEYLEQVCRVLAPGEIDTFERSA